MRALQIISSTAFPMLAVAGFITDIVSTRKEYKEKVIANPSEIKQLRKDCRMKVVVELILAIILIAEAIICIKHL